MHNFYVLIETTGSNESYDKWATYQFDRLSACIRVLLFLKKVISSVELYLLAPIDGPHWNKQNCSMRSSKVHKPTHNI